MNSEERAVQIYSVLVLAAKLHHLLSYETLGRIVGIPRFGLGSRLDPIQQYCKANGLPPLTAIVINESTGLPGDGFTEADGPIAILAAQARVFVFDWFSLKAPTTEEFDRLAADSLA